MKPGTEAGRRLLADRERHHTDCPMWFAVSVPEPKCTCKLARLVIAVEAQARLDR